MLCHLPFKVCICRQQVVDTISQNCCHRFVSIVASILSQLGHLFSQFFIVLPKLPYYPIIQILVITSLTLLSMYAGDKIVLEIVKLLLLQVSILLLHLQGLRQPQEMSEAKSDNEGECENEARCEEAIHLEILDVTIDLAPLNHMETLVQLLAWVKVFALLQRGQWSSWKAVVVQVIARLTVLPWLSTCLSASTYRFFLQVALLELLGHLLNSLTVVKMDWKQLLVKLRRIPLRFNLLLSDLSFPLRAPLVLQFLIIVTVDVVPGTNRDSIACHREAAEGGNLAAHSSAAAASANRCRDVIKV